MRASIEVFSLRVHAGITLLVNVVFTRGSVWADHRHVNVHSQRPLDSASCQAADLRHAQGLLACTCGSQGEPENQLIGQFRLSVERIMPDDICVWDG